MDSTNGAAEIVNVRALRKVFWIAAFFVGSAAIGLATMMAITNAGNPAVLFFGVAVLVAIGTFCGRLLAPRLLTWLRSTRTAAGAAQLISSCVLVATALVVVCVALFFTSSISAFSGKALMLACASLAVYDYCLAKKFAE